MKTAYREIFSSLPSGDRLRLQFYMGSMAVTGIISFYLNYKGPIFWNVPSIIFGLLFIYWSIDWKRAPGVYFWLIPISFWLTLLFDGFFVAEMIFNFHKPWQPILTSVVNMMLILVFGKTIFGYRRSIKTAQKDEKLVSGATGGR